MQALTAAPREELTEAEVRRLLTGNVTVVAGLELLDDENRFVEDISDDLIAAGSSVTHHGRATVHRDCHLMLMRQLAWGRDRVRPYVVLLSSAAVARFNLGVFVLVTPESKRGEVPATYDVTGYDLLQPLLDPIGDTWVAAAGTTYVQAIRDLLDAAGMGVPLLIDGTRQDTELEGPMVWALTDSDAATWLRAINDLLAAIGYFALHVDENGSYRSEPYALPGVRPVEHTFDTSDKKTDIVAPDRTVTEDVWVAPNRWVFVRRGMTTQPVEGDGLYTVDNLTTGASSQESIGRVRTRTVYLDAADQDALVAQGDQIVAADMSTTRSITLNVDPFPIFGHLDIVRIIDAGLDERAEVVEASIELDGSRAQWVLEVVR